jgi:hypothetical protein
MLVLGQYEWVAAYSRFGADFRGGACRAHSTPDPAAFEASIVTGISDEMTGELRILRGCVELLPEHSPQTLVPLTRIGNFEIWMFRRDQAVPGAMPLFWLELFDHGAGASVDSFGCNETEEAVVIFENFVSQIADLNDASGSGGTETHG